MRRLVFAALVLLTTLPARAQFATTEVSAPGSLEPFRVTKTGWTWENLDAGVTYSIHRSGRPDGGFACILDRHPTPDWTGDPALPAPGAPLHYLVTGFDGADDNSPGRRSDGTPRSIAAWCPRPCCLPDGSCQDVEPPQCDVLGGIAGSGADCASTACVQPIQACCMPDGSCADRGAADCVTAGGTPQGFATDCGTTACPQPPEACCFPDGSCADTSAADCAAAGGASQGAGTDCATTACPQPCGSGTPVVGRVPLQLVSIGANFTSPIFLTSLPGDPRLFILERAGRVIIQHPDGRRSTFADFRTRVAGTTGEMGALGLAFHPDYATNGLFYVHYSARAAECGNPASNCGTVSEMRRSAGDPDVADAAYERLLLQVPDFASNHNGGWIGFGPDGMLYIAYGDGGGGGDPQENGQDLAELLGKMLRIDVDGRDPGLPYAIPPDNPFVGTAGARAEIWSYGLRNHWRNSFDRLTGDLYIADVGQNRLEEIDVAPGTTSRGANYGWDDMEATDCFEPTTGCLTAGRVLPDHEYSHADGSCSITGGYVYRGCRMPDWNGWYFFADYCTEFIDAFNYALGVGATVERVFPDGAALNPVSFGEDSNGELYVVSQGGQVRRIEPQ